MDDRTQQILTSVDNLLRVHDEWEADDTSPVQPTIAFETAIEQAIATCDNGDIPGPCRDLCLSVSRLAVEWGWFVDGTRRTPDHRPIPSFWGAYRGVVTAREHARPRAMKQPEPVAILLENKVPPRQIAFHIWGYQGKGPFITAAGQVDELKIREEAKEPGKWTANWVHPEQLLRQHEQQRELSRRLGAAEHRERADTPTEDKATILELLKEGQYPDVIARVKFTTLEKVLQVARDNDIKPNERPNLGAERAPHEPPIFGSEIDDPLLGLYGVTDSTDEFGAEEIEQEAEPVQAVEDLIRSLNDGRRGVPEIVAACKQGGHPNVTFQQVKAALKTAKARK